MEPAATDKATEETKQGVSAQLRGETMAYAVQSGIYNLAGNFVEPYINYRVQKRYSGNGAGRHGSYAQNLAGEFAGDLIGTSTLLLAEALAPEQLHSFTRKARAWIDPLYDKIARAFLDKDCEGKDYEEKIERWKTFQERNFVRSAIMATAGIAGNVAIQKMMLGNPSPTSLVFKGKLLSTALTTAVGLGTRFAFPHHMNRLDKWMGEKFAPMMEDKGIATEAARTGERTASAHGMSHVERLAQQQQKGDQLEVTLQ